MVFVTDLTAELTILLYPTGGRVQPWEPGSGNGFARGGAEGMVCLVQLSGSKGLVLEHLLEYGGDGMLLRLGDFSDRTGQP